LTKPAVLVPDFEKNKKEFYMTNKELLYKDLSYKIIGCAMRVHRILGCYLPEHVYQKALITELMLSGIPDCTTQRSFQVYYKSAYAGHFFTDIIVEKKIVLELKSCEYISKEHQCQLLTYLHLSQLKVGYIINFGTSSLKFKRLIL
jgi:GxxExxY protein